MEEKVLERELKIRNLPDLFTLNSGEKVRTIEDWERRRAELTQMLQEYEYGFMPEPPLEIKFEETQTNNPIECAGKADYKRIKVTVTTKAGDYDFYTQVIAPTRLRIIPFIVYINFRNNIPDKYLPVEEIIDNGFGIATFCHNDIALDNEGCWEQENLLTHFFKDKKRSPDNLGTIMVWAWTASRVCDYLMMREDVDKKNISVMGHSRLGKTALVAGAFDERFSFVFANNSGMAGDALFRGKSERGEKLDSPFRHKIRSWYCSNLLNYLGREDELPIDQHFLVSLIAPRKVCGGAACEDYGADPVSQYLTYVASSKVWEIYGLKGFVHPDRYLNPNEAFTEGEVGFFLREGKHYHSRYDWHQYMAFIRKHYNT